MRKCPALAFSFQFTENKTKLGTKPMHLFYTGKKQRRHTLLILDTNTFMESLWDSFEAAWCPKGCESPKEKGQGKKRKDIFKPLEASCIPVTSIITLIWNQLWSYRKHTASKIVADHTQVIKIKVSFGLCGSCYLGCWVMYIQL